MDTNRIKRFATEARNILKAGIAAKIVSLGFDRKGDVAEEHRPQLMQGGTLWNSQLLPETFYHQWMSLYNRIQQKGINEVYEEAAYTWFNRLCAIRILQKNNFCAPVLDYTDTAHTPFIVDEARQGRIPDMNDDMRSRLDDLLDDDTKVTEQFAVLINAWCHNNPIINRCFGAMADYTELLLPNNILTEGGFMDMLNHTEFITDENYTSPELIGWLYQFYIAERKDEVFAKKGKFEADEIPAATQIFTPNWIVKYMVQNTVGRIYLDNNPYETQLQKRWQYLVEPAEKPSADSILKYDELTDLKVADLACGSGHILNECFDLLYNLYITEGYGRGEAIENIFRHNLTGIDLDTRAKQLATFALLLKACQKDAAFADGHCLPRVLDMPKVDRYTWRDLNGHFACWYQLSGDINGNELDEAFQLLEQADNLGSIMKFNISNDTRTYMKRCIQCYEDAPAHTESFGFLIQGFQLILALTEKYHALVMNPPYMGGGNMNTVLSKYVKRYYADSKSDLMTVFMEVCMQHIQDNGKYAMINLPSWLFLSSFEVLRKNIIRNYHIDSLLHMGRGIFGIDWGSTAFIVTKDQSEIDGVYFKLHQRNFQHIHFTHIGQLFLRVQKNHDFKYDFTKYRDDDVANIDVFDFSHYDNGIRLYFKTNQRNFEKIPGCPIGYWVSNDIVNLFNNYKISRIGISDGQNITGDNNKYIRYFWEVSDSKSGKGNHWVPMAKGGEFRRWYGNISEVVNWSDKARAEYKKSKIARIQDEYLWFRIGITWNLVSSVGTGFRLLTDDVLFNKAAPTIVVKEESLNDVNYVLGFLNTKITKSLLALMNPTINTNIAEVFNLPLIERDKNTVDGIVSENISISKLDWDAHETSWDFECNPIIAKSNFKLPTDEELKAWREKHPDEIMMIKEAMPMDSGLLSECMAAYKADWERRFMQLHANEEELNRQFIKIYGLQNELTPDVPMDEITILQQGEICLAPCPGSETMYGAAIQWNDDVVMKQFISYAVGCMMGRYRLDKKGLHIAHPNPTDEETALYIYNKVEFEIDEDGIIPLMPNDCGFSDNASNRFADFVRIALGDGNHVNNLNFVEKCLGKSVEQYFVKDFWKDHKKMYQNRPIYWLFSSKKGAFQCIAYMHRMNAYTAERIRAKYLLPYIETLQARITNLDARRSELTTRESKQLLQLTKTLEECREYHERLQVVAEQAIAFDLDDGVVVNYTKFGDVLQKIK